MDLEKTLIFSLRHKIQHYQNIMGAIDVTRATRPSQIRIVTENTFRSTQAWTISHV